MADYTFLREEIEKYRAENKGEDENVNSSKE